VLTSRPGHFRTDTAEPVADQVDVLTRADVSTLAIDPLPSQVARDAVSQLTGGENLLQSVEGLEQLATSPLLLHVVQAAVPFIEPGRPIQPWGVFDAWLRYALSTGPGHDAVLGSLEQLAWDAFRDLGFRADVPTWPAAAIASADLPPVLRRALLVTDLDGRLRFGHRSVYEFLLASRIAPQLGQNQGQGPDALSGLHLTEAIRVFLVGRTPAMRVAYQRDRVLVPRGNFVAGGDLSPDERPLRIAHLAQPVWIARAPVTNADWGRYLNDRPDERIDANYLRHWGMRRSVPLGQEEAPVYHVWPEDADRYAAWAGGRLPTADEREKAVRGIDGRRWPWGDYWKADVAVTSELGLDRPLPVRAFGAQGEVGLFSAAGGVFEYTSTSYRGRPDRGRVVMGGCFTHPSSVSRTSLRLSHKLSGHLKAGLRLAWDP
jgi:formylglycine-generating enzyme required for sulfatase activity